MNRWERTVLRASSRGYVVALCAALLCLFACVVPVAARGPAKRVVLIGASVGEAWDVPHAPARMGRQGYEIDFQPLYDFDKTAALDRWLPRRFDAVIIKECAAYFPGDLAAYRRLVKGWVGRCRAAKTMVILSTSCTVTEDGPQLRAIAAYNDWIRAYAAREGIPVLDLEAAVRVSARDRRLRKAYAQEDGLHLLPAAYRRLDPVLLQTLDRAFAR